MRVTTRHSALSKRPGRPAQRNSDGQAGRLLGPWPTVVGGAAAGGPAAIILPLQRTIGNVAVRRLLTGIVQRQIEQTFDQWRGKNEASMDLLASYLADVVQPEYDKI